MATENNKISKSKYVFLTLAALIVVLFVWFHFLRAMLANIETSFYDYRARQSIDYSFFKQKYKKAAKDIVILGIDDYSIQKLAKYRGLGTGRYPWSRRTIAEITNFVNQGKPKAIVLDLMFEGEEGEFPENIKSDKYLAQTLKGLKNTSIALLLNNSRANHTDLTLSNNDISNNQLDNILKKQNKIDTPSFKTGLGLKIDDELSNLSVNNSRAKALLDNITFFSYNPLLKLFVNSTNHIGIVNLKPDEDGIARYHKPLYKLVTNNDVIYLPSLSLSTVLNILPEKEKTPFVLTDNKIILGKRVIPLDNKGRFLVNWHGPGGPAGDTYTNMSIAKVVISNALNNHKIKVISKEDKIFPEIFKNKIVVIGRISSGSDIHATSMEANYPGPEIVATCIDNLLHDTSSESNTRKIITIAPFWVNAAILLLFCLAVGVFNLKARNNYLSILWFFMVLISFIFFSFVMFVYFRYWTNMVYPIVFIVITAIGSYLYKIYTANKEKKDIENLFGKFVSPQVLDKLLKDPSIISREGTRKYMTVLFSDIRGFTTLSEKIPAQELVSQLNEYFNEIYEIILSHNGTLDKYIGDAVMAFYGDPLPLKDHALQAVLTAMDMMNALQKLNQKWTQEGKHVLDIGIGINTGDMIVGHLGAKKMVSYTVMGDSVNLASRLESLNKDYKTKIIIGHSTYEEVKDFVNAVYLGEVKVKGKEDAVKVYSIESIQVHTYADLSL